MNQTDKGKGLAAEVNETMFQAHRGAFVRRGELIVFGNDGYEGDDKGRPKREVEAAVAWAKGHGLEVTDFGTDADGHSWALVCRGGRAHDLRRLAVEAEDVLRKAWVGDNPGPLS